MPSIELLPFQVTASNTIAERYRRLACDEDRPYEKRTWPVPFYQALSALTGAGKTPILADAVTQIRAELPVEPIVLWISKAKAVVDQTRANFEPGGKYSHLIPGFLVIPLGEARQSHLGDASAPLLVLATVGSFNQKSKEDGTLRVHRVEEDTRDDALWKLLRDRSVDRGDKSRRPLVIVYDEAHNLSDQQADLLLELEPDVLLVASATMKTPGRLGLLIERLRQHGWDDGLLVTGVSSPAVVDAGLVKRQVVLGGYTTIMEAAINDLLEQMAMVQRKAEALNAGFTPKAIYVCRTNISQLDGTRDVPTRPFSERQAPPILIWRHLVKRGIDRRHIAVYCDLKVDHRGNPLPGDFNLFSGGEDDFATFSAGDYRHVIFNQSLQEGWDDPACCFAYVDKSMGSPIQVEQVIGRVLRQPGARHHPDMDLNSAHFFIRVDSRQTFPDILEEVRKRIGAEIPEVRIEGYVDAKARAKLRREPKKVLTIPAVMIHTEPEPLLREIARVIDYSRDLENVRGRGQRLKAVQTIGGSGAQQITTEELAHSNRVTARWIVRRGIQVQYPRAVATIDWSLAKFDARVEITSPAAEGLRRSADDLVRTYFEYSDLVLEEANPYSVGPVLVDPSRLTRFHNALHDGYSDLRESELPFAKAIDSLGFPWVRNPENGGFSIPLLSSGGTFDFYPDFLVWKAGTVYAIDPKGSHLVAEAAWRKLFNISNDAGKVRLVVRLISDGRWISPGECLAKTGYTVWSRSKADQVKPRHHESVDEAVAAALT